MGVVMSDLLTSLPGDIPGLLLRGSPIIHGLRFPWRGLVLTDGVRSDGSILGASPASETVQGPIPATRIALDLTDPTGRAHAAWWADERAISLMRAAADVGPHALGEIMDTARRGGDMTPAQIDALARLVLRLAGRS